MNVHDLPLYACAAAVVGPGIKVLTAPTAGARPRQGDGPQGGLQALLNPWRQRPLPLTAAAMVAVMVGFNLAQTVWPALIPHLERRPGGPWWRAFTALLIESSGPLQLLFNLAALVAVVPVAQRVLRPAVTVCVYLVSGVAAQAVSMAGWSPTGGGNSVAICGLVGALAVAYALRGPDAALRRMALFVPAAGIVLCAMANNHGVGVLVGCALGAGLTAVRRSGHLVNTPAQ
ncbi:MULTISPECIES: rhomboid family intramembrane serine protease [unclassified Streptomyces]|uniref:rhomboid family intramembrane serine protease n=1 Tax=unclassified Streptomyces TaxID=2593676 RepID=UPI002E1BA729